ncbi:MAG TPA: hypothetical protein VJN18_25140 [Polyangiaceae bacterium]|nr:hypothetical protein [Polyangiaceae bacterium]
MTTRRRTNHGRDRELHGERQVYETVTDGVRPVPAGAAAPVERRDDGTVTAAGAAELARMSAEARRLPDFGDRTQPWMPPAASLAPFDEARRDLLTQRRRELREATGGVDSGVGAQLRAWAYIHAAGEYWASQFYGTGDPEAFERMVRAFKASSSEDARMRDAAVWAAEARAKQGDALPPWFKQESAK